MHFTPLEILPFKTYDSLVLSIFAVCGPQSSLNSNVLSTPEKKPHTHWLTARAPPPLASFGEPQRPRPVSVERPVLDVPPAPWALQLTPSPLAWLLSVFLSCSPFSESILLIAFLALPSILSCLLRF